MIVSQQANWLCLSIHCTVQPRYRLLLYVTVYIYDTQSQNLGRVCPSPFALYIHPVVQLHIYATSTSSTSSYTRAGHAIASSRSGHCVPRPTHQGLAFSTRCTTALQHDASVGGPGLVAAALLEHRSHLVGIGQPRLRHAVLREQPPVLRALPLQRGVAAAEAADQAAEAESGRSRSGCLSATGPLINWITTFPRRSGAEATREAVRGLRLMALEQGAVP